jgi:lipoprotein-anchoring transpeptidase ErfK/SrfK
MNIIEEFTPTRPVGFRRLLSYAALGVIFAISGCSQTSAPERDSASKPEAPSGSIVINAGSSGPVPVDQPVQVRGEDAVLTDVTVNARGGVSLDGALTNNKQLWRLSDRLEPGVTYRVTATGESLEGEPLTETAKVVTQDLSLDQQTFASIAPLQGETVGVGMPVIVTFDIPVTDRAAIEQHMKVQVTPAQKGAWRWLSDSEVHWRPASYWQAGSKVMVDIDINSIAAGGGIYGQESRFVEFDVGDSVIHKVNAATHQMSTVINGQVVRTTPITTGKPGFTTRSGVKVIMEKFSSRRMRSETVGIPEDSAEGYDIDNVRYAMRVTYSGEFLHAAPWSVASQGSENVSHGCTGMSTANARWVYERSKRGDVVEYTGTDRPMALTNGWGDWNLSFAEWGKGSARG